ncbi:sensor histidine kinase [Kribbella solani]|uniref:sensor histidine kinase n=1 Tax=Kribbella solani TaxID=236067 RepID=UPI0029AAE56A|nr:sensor histidine kinase [Kribbella solani]MDX2968158.1 sensor histidine kinase [Kribbella solani]
MATARPLANLASSATRAWTRWAALHDAVLAAALLLGTLATSKNLLTGPVRHLTNVDGDVQLAVWIIASVAIAVGVALRRRQSWLMLVVCAAASAVHLVQGMPLLIIDLGTPILLYTVASSARRTYTLAATAGLILAAAGWSMYAGATGTPTAGVPDRIAPPISRATAPAGEARPTPSGSPGILQDTSTGVILLGSILVTSWAMGSAARNRRDYLDELHARAADLERERDQQAALAVAAERDRITRELHDVVAHGLSVMVTQAQGAEAALTRRPGDTRSALSAIISTGRDSLADMRRVLSRADSLEDAWHPQPGIDRLPELVAHVTKAGTRVRLQVNGTPAAVPAAVDLSAYRIVQEALTNTMKHAGSGAAATVNLTFHDSEVVIEVKDNGRGQTSSDGNGHGLRGMGERARLLDGQLTAGPGPLGGFVVRATLPIDRPRP